MERNRLFSLLSRRGGKQNVYFGLLRGRREEETQNIYIETAFCGALCVEEGGAG